MTRAIKLLQVEDSEDDAALIVHMLEKAGYAVDAERVETEEQLRRALATGACDLVIADYRLPQFSAPEALKVFQETHLDVPFIVVSGVMGSETAISMMKAGAHDFLLKERLERLTPAVERELNEACLLYTSILTLKYGMTTSATTNTVGMRTPATTGGK